MAGDEIEHAIDERLPLQIGQLPEDDAAAEMFVAVGVAAGTAQRALARNLDREGWPVSGQDPAPRLNDCSNFHRRPPFPVSGVASREPPC